MYLKNKKYSLNVLLSSIGCLFLVLHFIPFFNTLNADNDSILWSYSFLFTGIYFLIISFKPHYVFLKVIHKIVAVIIGIVAIFVYFIATYLTLLGIVAVIIPLFNEIDIDIQWYTLLFPIILQWCMELLALLMLWMPLLYFVFDTHTQKINRKYNKDITLVLAYTLGIFGVHRYYVGRIYSGFLYMSTCGLFLTGVIHDIINPSFLFS